MVSLVGSLWFGTSPLVMSLWLRSLVLLFHLVIFTTNGTWILTTVYNTQILSKHKRLWRALSLKSLFLTFLSSLMVTLMPLLALRNIRKVFFKSYASKSRSFYKFILDNNLHDLGFSSPCFTWCNAQQGLAHKWARLDHFLATTSWLLNFQDFINHHLPRTNSDHSVLFLHVHLSKKFSKFFLDLIIFLLDYEGCHNSVLNAGLMILLLLLCILSCIVFPEPNIISLGGRKLASATLMRSSTTSRLKLRN